MPKKSNAAIVMFDNADPLMQQAYQSARATFRFLWRELAWERRRIVKAISLAAVKVPFSDDGASEVEHMWVSELDFDGLLISGKLLSSPNSVISVKAGDAVHVAVSELSDWLFAIGGHAYGGHTVNLMRSRMTDSERKNHDKAWGLDFGAPQSIRLVYDPNLQIPKPGFLKSLFSKKPAHTETDRARDQVSFDEHPMSAVMQTPLRQMLAENPAMVHEKDERGWTMLHHEALAGSAATVQVLLEVGADKTALTPHGMTACQLANTLDWQRVVAML